MEELIKPKGTIEIVFEIIEGNKTSTNSICINNKILRTGRIALTNALANNFGSSFEYFITGMSFGSGGTSGGVIRYIDDTRESLFGPTLITKGVISSINSETPTKVTLTSVLTFDEAVGEIINEMALRMRNGSYFSMATFGDITKTSSTQLTFNWSLNFV